MLIALHLLSDVALSNDDIAHIKKMLISIYESIKTIRDIDRLKKSYLVELGTFK